VIFDIYAILYVRALQQFTHQLSMPPMIIN